MLALAWVHPINQSTVASQGAAENVGRGNEGKENVVLEMLLDGGVIGGITKHSHHCT